MGELAAVRLTERVPQERKHFLRRVLPSQSAPYGAASSPIGGAKGCVGSDTPNYNLSGR